MSSIGTGTENNMNLVMKRFLIVYYPFPGSDVTSEMEQSGKDYDDVVTMFRENYPMWSIKEVREQ